jgi:mercuric ion binding protein
MKTRPIIGVVGVLLLMAAMSPSVAAKDATVTLAISGMTWGSCASTVQSALEAVKGVKEVNVSLENKEAVVKYDADVVKVEDLIKAVKNARGMSPYDAKVKRTWKRRHPLWWFCRRHGQEHRAVLSALRTPLPGGRHHPRPQAQFIRPIVDI